MTVLQMADANGPEFDNLLTDNEMLQRLLDTGYTKPLLHIYKQDMLSALAVHVCLLSVKAELDQLREILETLHVRSAMMKHPHVFQCLFVAERNPLTAGTCSTALIYVPVYIYRFCNKPALCTHVAMSLRNIETFTPVLCASASTSIRSIVYLLLAPIIAFAVQRLTLSCNAVKHTSISAQKTVHLVSISILIHFCDRLL